MAYDAVPKVCVTGTIAALTAFWGWCGWLWLLWILCLVADHFTGTAAACKAGAWCSYTARAGIWGKLGSMIVVLVTAALDFVLGRVINSFQGLPFNYTTLLAPIVLTWYILTELGSILENVGQMGAKIPPFLTKWIAVLKKQVGETAVGSLDERDEDE
ncbi:MAG: phage holin family protein [Oscillospiraceae bacterium]|nr:phage holin family protein [Oscillospiraceae bacterium]